MKYKSKWRSKESGNIYELGMHYVQNDVTYYFLNMGMHSKFLSEDVIRLYFEVVDD